MTFALIASAREAGLQLRADGCKLKLSGPAEVVELWKPTILASKPAILATMDGARSTWWLLHFTGDKPHEVWTSPPATHGEILERHPDAIAAEPLRQAAPEPAHTCSTCKHATGRGGCGEPVAAGLSADDGVIRYHPNNGVNCTAWLAGIPPDL